LVYTSGAGVIGHTGGRTVTEDEPLRTPPGMTWRRDLELAVLEAGGIVIQPSFVYGRAGGDILGALIRDTIARGYACYAEPGDNPMPAVHVDDLGRGYTLALQHAG
jgi:nucleoside-diphosphate-sugar epimerase